PGRCAASPAAQHCTVRFEGRPDVVARKTWKELDAMRMSRTVLAAVAATTALAVSVAGCGNNKPQPSPSKSGSATSATSAPSSPSSASSAPAQPNEYTKLLIQASD